MAVYSGQPMRRHFYGLSLTTLATALFFLLSSPCRASIFDPARDEIAILAGYGQSIPGWGLTTERVETIDLVPRYNHVAFDNLGWGWWRGNYCTMVESPVHLVVNPDTSLMVGLNFLGRYSFTAATAWQPYIFGGGGPVYSFADIKGMGAKLNGNYQFAIGLEHPTSTGHALLLELRYHHISNAGVSDPNVPLNSLKVLFGMTF
ncbi:MAG: acyloxyacyl hydrolase [Desulfopila sp.]